MSLLIYNVIVLEYSVRSLKWYQSKSMQSRELSHKYMIVIELISNVRIRILLDSVGGFTVVLGSNRFDYSLLAEFRRNLYQFQTDKHFSGL